MIFCVYYCGVRWGFKVELNTISDLMSFLQSSGSQITNLEMHKLKQSDDVLIHL